MYLLHFFTKLKTHLNISDFLPVRLLRHLFEGGICTLRSTDIAKGGRFVRSFWGRVGPEFWQMDLLLKLRVIANEFETVSQNVNQE